MASSSTSTSTADDPPPWGLIHDMLADRRYLVHHQLESYNDFLRNKIGQVLAHYSRQQIEIGMRFEPTMVVGKEVRDMMKTHPGMRGFRRKLSIRMDNHALGLASIEETTGHKTDMTPHHARIRNLTYSAPLHVDIHLLYEHVNDEGLLDASHRKTIKNVLIGRVPVMVGSIACRLVAQPLAGGACPKEECRYDLQGYFIVNGMERVVVSTDRIADNKVLIFQNSRSATSGYEADIRSVAYDCLVPQKLTLKMDHTKAIKYGKPIVALMRAVRGGKEIPLYVLFRALGVEKDADIQRYILCGAEATPELEGLLQASAKHAADETGVFDRLAAREWLRTNLNTKHHSKRFGREWVAHPVISAYLLDLTMDEELLPHCGPDAHTKALFLGHMTLRLLRVTQGLEPPDNRDTYLNKRVETPGAEFTTLFRTQVNKVIGDSVPKIKKMMEEAPPDKFLEGIDQKNINLLFKPSLIEKALERALATGNFGSNKMQILARSMMGMSQLFNRMNYMAAMSHLRRFMSHIERNGKMVAPRKLDVSHYGIICMSETPEGAPVGIVKNMSVSCYVTLAHNPAPALAVLAPFVVRHPDPGAGREAVRAFLAELGAGTAVFFNGAILGYATDPVALCRSMRAAKRVGDVPHVTSVVWRPRERTIKMSLEAGRPCRPLFVVGDDGRCAWRGGDDFNAAMRAGEIEMMDPEETASAMIAMTPADLRRPATQGCHLKPRYTHAEIHPCMALGVLANNIPFSNCNQSPRNVYQCLAPDEPVLLAGPEGGGGMRAVQHVRVGDVVATFDPATRVLGRARVTATMAAPPRRPVVEVRTRCGLALRVTDDHRLLCASPKGEVGWATAAEVAAVLAAGGRVGVATFEPAPATHAAYLGRAAGARDGGAPVPAGAGPDADDFARAAAAPKPAEPDAKGFFVGYAASGARATDHERAEALEAAHLGAVDAVTGELHVPHTCGAKERLLRYGGVPFDRARHAALRLEVDLLRGEDVVVVPAARGGAGDAVFVAVEEVVALPVQPDAVYDLTIEGGDAKNPCFVAGRGAVSGAGGFGVHNSAMGKQAMGTYATSFLHRLDGMAHMLHTTQRPLVGTKMSSLLGVDVMTNGINVTVLIASMTHNQEDAVIINKASMQRGLFASSYWKTHKDRVLKNFATGEEETLTADKPDARNALKNNYGMLTESGLPALGAAVGQGDVLIGKVMRNKAGRPAEDNSYVLQKNDGGVVSHVHYNPREVDYEGYKFIKVELLNVREPEIGDKFSCYAPDHDVLTTAGWVPVADVTLEHRVATLGDDGGLVYRHPTEVQSYDFAGNMYRVESNHVDLLVTPNHRMWVKKMSNGAAFGAETAEEAYGNLRFYKKDVDAWAPDLSGPDLPRELVLEGDRVTGFRLPGDGDGLPDPVVPIEPWLTFFGIWMAEGWIQSSWGIAIAAHKPRVKDALTDVCAEAKLNFPIHKHMEKPHHTEPHRWCMPNKQLVSYLQRFNVGAINKDWPEWVWYLSRAQCRVLIDGIFLGDGHSIKGAHAQNATRRLDTSSTRLADGFQRLCLHAGFSSNKTLRSEAGSSSQPIKATTVDAFRLSVIASHNEPKVNKNKTGSGATAANMQDHWEPYTGKVHCCTVPGRGVIYVRRGGCPVWCGNSRHGQKGTLGELRNAWDMPVSASGVRPDVVINPHAIPSRMTIAQLMEMLLGKGVALDGRHGDGTPFSERDVLSEAGDLLSARGFQRHGNETFYDGATGQKLGTELFVGVAYYQRLKHCAADKIHSRATHGKVQVLTRQPNEGRARGGGLRLGEMERDGLLSQGVSAFIKERLLDNSDNFQLYVCKKCGMPALNNIRTGLARCLNDKCPGEPCPVRVPFAFNLLAQELASVNVAVRLRT